LTNPTSWICKSGFGCPILNSSGFDLRPELPKIWPFSRIQQILTNFYNIDVL
jgi:hypothetical protein